MPWPRLPSPSLPSVPAGPLRQPRSSLALNRHMSVKRAGGRIVDLCPTCLSLLEESLVMSQSVCLSSCIHRSVTYCRPPGGGHWPKGAAVGGIPRSDECIPLSGQRPFTISSQKWRTLIFLLCPTFLTHLWHFHIVPKWQQRLQVMFKFMDGAQTLSRFCLFAVLYFIIILVVVVVFFLVVRIKM